MGIMISAVHPPPTEPDSKGSSTHPVPQTRFYKPFSLRPRPRVRGIAKGERDEARARIPAPPLPCWMLRNKPVLSTLKKTRSETQCGALFERSRSTAGSIIKRLTFFRIRMHRRPPPQKRSVQRKRGNPRRSKRT